MRYSPAVESTPLLRPMALILVLVVVVVVLVLSYRSTEVFMPDSGKTDAVSVGYAELLLNADPQNTQLRAELVGMLIELGEFQRARDYLDAWGTSDLQLKQFYSLLLDANIAIVSGAEEGLARASEQLRQLDPSGLGPEEKATLVELALALGLPGTAAGIQRDMAAIQPDKRSHLLSSAAQNYLAAGQQQQAAELFSVLADEADTPAEAQEWIWSAYDALLAADNPGEASVYLLSQLDAGRIDTLSQPQWQRSISQAQGALRMDLADRLSSYWQIQQPDSLPALQTRFDLQLAAGNLEGAWQTGQQLLAAAPPSADQLRQMALLAQWRNQPEQALDYWLAYLEKVPDAATRDATWRLAMQLFDYDRGIELLLATANSRQLTDEELNALIYAQEQRGTPELAEQWLRSYLRSVKGQRLAWTRLLQNLQNTLQPAAEETVWKEFSAHHKLTVAERVSWAEVLWNLYQPESAWQVLEAGPIKDSTADYWRLRAALAWELGLEREMQSSYESMLAQGIQLMLSEQRQLIDVYQREHPQLALKMLVDGWRSTGDGRYLTDALPLAEDLQDWALLKTLLAEAGAQPSLARLLPVRMMQARLAEYEGRDADAERLYLQALNADPENVLLRQQLLWLYISTQQQPKIAARLLSWETQADKVASMWLVMAAANQSLGRHERALQWYTRHLRSHPDDVLAQIASADALEGAGRHAAALQLRSQLLPRLNVSSAARESTVQRELWSRLMTVAGGRQQSMAQLQRWQDGSAGMLQLWYAGQLAQLDETNQEAQKDAWLAWGRARGLTEDRYQGLQEALRKVQRDELAARLQQPETDVASRVAILDQLGDGSQALAEALSNLGDEQPLAVRQQLWRQAVALTERYPQGIRLGFQREDFGGLQLQGPQLQVARFIDDDWYLQLDSSRPHYRSDLLDSGRLGAEENAQLRLQRQLANGDFSLSLDQSFRADDDRTGLAVARRWVQGTNDLELGLNWHRESRTTGLLRALGQEDAIWLAASHAFTARDQLSVILAQRRFETRSGADIGAGQQASLEFSQIQFFSGPTWILRTGLEVERNSLTNNSLDSLLTLNGGVVRQSQLTAAELLPERVGRVYIGTQLRRGMPGALNRTRGQYTWLLDASTGWDWEEQSTTFGVTAGIGVEVLGDDELSFSAGYQSAPVGGAGDAGGTATISYSSRFGR